MPRGGTFLQVGFALLIALALTRESSAQAISPPSKSGTRLFTLGTVAGPIPRANRAQSSNLLIVNGTQYVVDAGDGVTRRIAQAGFNVRDVGTIFITHHHDDHTAGLGTLMSVAWGSQRTRPINVYGPPRTTELVQAAVQYYSISSEIRIADGGRTIPIGQLFFGHDVGTGVIFQDANIKVTAIENTHFEFHSGPAAGKHKSYSYRFETPHRVIVFTGDTGPNDAGRTSPTRPPAPQQEVCRELVENTTGPVTHRAAAERCATPQAVVAEAKRGADRSVDDAKHLPRTTHERQREPPCRALGAEENRVVMMNEH